MAAIQHPRVNLHALRKRHKALVLNIQILPDGLMTRKGTLDLSAPWQNPSMQAVNTAVHDGIV
jgi:hypothetical protein